MSAATPRNASTVVLLRPEPGGKFEAFFTRRPKEMKFLGGYYVFPGGGVRRADCSEGMLNRCRGISSSEAQRLLGYALSPDLSLGHWVAGIRELFEETGVLLCVTESGEPADMNREGMRKRLAEAREALINKSVDFLSLLESESLYCNVDAPVYFSHRVTPEKHSIRFDTRFYLARLPADQTPLFCSQEVVESRWITPGRALELAQRDGLPLMPPTVAALEKLDGFESWQSLSEHYRL